MGVIALTGGIASGKSTVCGILEKFGCEIIDADKIARNVVQKGKTAWRQIVDYFSSNILKPDGQLDRTKLSNIIFSDSLKRNKINKIIHPHILNQTNKRINIVQKINPERIIVVDMPLFFEIFKNRMDLDVILVYVPEHIQIERLMKIRGYNKTDALVRINSQIPMNDKRKLTPIIIDNSGCFERTKEITHLVFNHIKAQNIIPRQNEQTFI